MKDSSVNALLVMSIILLVPGTAIISPDGRLFFVVFAGVCSGIAAIAGKSKRKRIMAILVFVVALGLAISTYSEHRIFFDKYRKTGHSAETKF